MKEANGNKLMDIQKFEKKRRRLPVKASALTMLFSVLIPLTLGLIIASYISLAAAVIATVVLVPPILVKCFIKGENYIELYDVVHDQYQLHELAKDLTPAEEDTVKKLSKNKNLCKEMESLADLNLSDEEYEIVQNVSKNNRISKAIAITNNARLLENDYELVKFASKKENATKFLTQVAKQDSDEEVVNSDQVFNHHEFSFEEAMQNNKKKIKAKRK